MQDTPNQAHALKDESVAEYLRNDPNFFERNPSLLAEIHLPSPHGKGTISLMERQQLAQRDKIQATEAIMEELVGFGKKNDITNQQLHALGVSLMTDMTLESIANTIEENIKDAFALPHASLHCWGVDQDAIVGTPEEFISWVSQQIAPYCGEQNAAIKSLVSTKVLNESLKSFALIPLFTPIGEETNQTSPSIGVLILGADDATHFHPEMGTLFLQRIGELLSASLIRIAIS